MNTFELDFCDSSENEKGLPGEPRAQIVLGYFTSREGGMPHVSSECVSVTELEHEVARLKRELDRVLASGKTKFAKVSAPRN
jgi:uncharacterized small protein (DUF1192 family)